MNFVQFNPICHIYSIGRPNKIESRVWHLHRMPHYTVKKCICKYQQLWLCVCVYNTVVSCRIRNQCKFNLNVHCSSCFNETLLIWNVLNAPRNGTNMDFCHLRPTQFAKIYFFLSSNFLFLLEFKFCSLIFIFNWIFQLYSF